MGSRMAWLAAHRGPAAGVGGGLIAFGALLVAIALAEPLDAGLLLAGLLLGAVGLVLIIAPAVAEIGVSLRRQRDQRFIPGQEPLMQTPLEHQVTPSGSVIDSEWADQAIRREEVLYGQRPADWNFFHFAWPTELGGPSVWLEAHGPEDDHRQNVWCLVRAPDGSTKERDMTSAFSGPPSEPELVDAEWRYPQDFPEGAETPYLDDGKYVVEWRGQAGVGRDLLGTDCFLIESGQVRNCDGTLAETSPSFED